MRADVVRVMCHVPRLETLLAMFDTTEHQEHR